MLYQAWTDPSATQPTYSRHLTVLPGSTSALVTRTPTTVWPGDLSGQPGGRSQQSALENPRCGVGKTQQISARNR